MAETSGSTFYPQGRKDDTGKLRFDLLPADALEEVAKVYTIGARKYADRNWEKGIKFGRVYGALMRHMIAWWKGERHAQDDGQHHLASVAWCALALLHYDLNSRYESFDDRPIEDERQMHLDFIEAKPVEGK